MVTKVTDAEFFDELKSNDKVAVKFYADWCGNCPSSQPSRAFAASAGGWIRNDSR